jgi:hypothetical protein
MLNVAGNWHAGWERERGTRPAGPPVLRLPGVAEPDQRPKAGIAQAGAIAAAARGTATVTLANGVT